MSLYRGKVQPQDSHNKCYIKISKNLKYMLPSTLMIYQFINLQGIHSLKPRKYRCNQFHIQLGYYFYFTNFLFFNFCFLMTWLSFFNYWPIVTCNYYFDFWRLRFRQTLFSLIDWLLLRNLSAFYDSRLIFQEIDLYSLNINFFKSILIGQLIQQTVFL